MTITLQKAGPQVTVQDAGRTGGLGLGLSRGGAADFEGYLVGCALLGQPLGTAAIEMAGFGGVFRLQHPTRFALSGAMMRATLDGVELEWRASHFAKPGQVLDIGAVLSGVYGYVSFGGGIATQEVLGGRGYHGIAGLGRVLKDGDALPLGEDEDQDAAPLRYRASASTNAPIRVMPGPQTAEFQEKTRSGFQSTVFTRSPRANRQGVRLDHEGAPFSSEEQLNRVSDFIAEGDVQMTGDGTPYVLLADCQTMGGYPRIGTVIPEDLPRIAQAMPGADIRFQLITLAEAEAAWKSDEARLQAIKSKLEPRTRDPREMADLLSYELIDRPGKDVTE